MPGDTCFGRQLTLLQHMQLSSLVLFRVSCHPAGFEGSHNRHMASAQLRPAPVPAHGSSTCRLLRGAGWAEGWQEEAVHAQGEHRQHSVRHTRMSKVSYKEQAGRFGRHRTSCTGRLLPPIVLQLLQHESVGSLSLWKAEPELRQASTLDVQSACRNMKLLAPAWLLLLLPTGKWRHCRG